MKILNFSVFFLLLQPAIAFNYEHYLSGKKPMMKVWNEADLDKDMCAPVSDSFCGDLVVAIVDKGDFNFKCVMPCRFFANLTVDEVFKYPDMDCTVEKFHGKMSEDQFWVRYKNDRDENVCQVTEGKLCCKHFDEKKRCLNEVYSTPYN